MLKIVAFVEERRILCVDEELEREIEDIWKREVTSGVVIAS